jgi:hypothetical protein
MKIALFLLFSICSAVSFAQDSTSFGGSSVVVHKDPRMDALVERQSYINIAVKKAAGRTMRGYRLMIINTNSRDEAIAAKTKIYTHFPDQKAYLTYQSPFFKLKAGNFQTRDEAKRYQSLMNSLFPKGVFIINDTIEVKPEKEAEDSSL